MKPFIKASTQYNSPELTWNTLRIAENYKASNQQNETAIKTVTNRTQSPKTNTPKTPYL
jgi:hypothetical protein